MRITKFLSALFLSSVFALSSVYATNVKITALTEETAPIASDILVMVDDPSGTPITEKVTYANLFASAANIGASTIVTVGALDAGSITANFGAIDNGTDNIRSGGIWRVDVDGTGLGAAGALGFGAGPDDAGWYWDGGDFVGTSTGGFKIGFVEASSFDFYEGTVATNTMRIDYSAIGSDTALMLYNSADDGLVRVTTGINNSGGTGRRALTVPNL